MCQVFVGLSLWLFFAPKINSRKFSTPTLFLNYFSWLMCACICACVRVCVCVPVRARCACVCVHVSLCVLCNVRMRVCVSQSVCVYGNVGHLPSVSLACSVVAPRGLDRLSWLLFSVVFLLRCQWQRGCRLYFNFVTIQRAELYFF